MTTYRAIHVDSDGSLQLTRKTLVEPAAGQVRVAVESCGVCHSDSAAVHPHPAAAAGRVPGHEAVGRIDALGAGVPGWSIGDRVGVGFLGGHCGVCGQCRRGRFVACADQPRTGITVDGGYAEYLYARQTGLVSIPEQLSSVDASPLLCAGFTTYNALLKAQLKPGNLVAVQGIGGLGHLGVQYARKMGATVVAIARGAAKADLARGFGAHHYIDSTAAEVGAELTKLGGADIVLATAASGASMTALIPGLANPGRLMAVGASSEPIEISPLSLIFDGVTVAGSLTGSSNENGDNLRFAVQHGVSAMIEESTLDGAPAAYARMMSGAARFRMVLTIN